MTISVDLCGSHAKLRYFLEFHLIYFNFFFKCEGQFCGNKGRKSICNIIAEGRCIPKKGVTPTLCRYLCKGRLHVHTTIYLDDLS